LRIILWGLRKLRTFKEMDEAVSELEGGLSAMTSDAKNPQANEMGNMKLGGLFVEDAAISSSPETAHTLEEPEQGGWTNDDRGSGG